MAVKTRTEIRTHIFSLVNIAIHLSVILPLQLYCRR